MLSIKQKNELRLKEIKQPNLIRLARVHVWTGEINYIPELAGSAQAMLIMLDALNTSETEAFKWILTTTDKDDGDVIITEEGDKYDPLFQIQFPLDVMDRAGA